jgi:DNA-binding CsgD family transcriptional regulator
MYFEDKIVKILGKNVKFTGKELALLTLLNKNMTPQQIAESAEVSVVTVYSQLRYAIAKLNVKSYDKAAKKAERLGLI